VFGNPACIIGDRGSNTSGGADILNEDILRTYGNLNSSTVMLWDGNSCCINSKTSADVVSGVKRDTNSCFLYGTTERLFLPPPAI